ncbi:MAG TPA: hypothetical protein VFQ45_04090 [Longimicrobium sp.]|nr:hypothetical protein [Longimicrobium sp.]
MIDFQDTRVGTYVDRRGRHREVRIEQVDPALIAAFRRMTPEQRLAAGLKHSAFISRQARAFISAQNPTWTQAQVRDELARRTLGRRR